jgi:hypothetical protein
MHPALSDLLFNFTPTEEYPLSEFCASLSALLGRDVTEDDALKEIERRK